MAGSVNFFSPEKSELTWIHRFGTCYFIAPVTKHFVIIRLLSFNKHGTHTHFFVNNSRHKVVIGPLILTLIRIDLFLSPKRQLRNIYTESITRSLCTSPRDAWFKYKRLVEAVLTSNQTLFNLLVVCFRTQKIKQQQQKNDANQYQNGSDATKNIYSNENIIAAEHMKALAIHMHTHTRAPLVWYILNLMKCKCVSWLMLRNSATKPNLLHIQQITTQYKMWIYNSSENV